MLNWDQIHILDLIVKYLFEFSKVKIGSKASINSNVMINARGKGKLL